MKPLTHWIALSALLIALPGHHAVAQLQPVLTEERGEEYQVELVIFAHVDGAANASEDFLAEPDPPALEEIRVREFPARPPWGDELSPRSVPETLRQLEEIQVDVAPASATLPARRELEPVQRLSLPAHRPVVDPERKSLTGLYRRLAAAGAYEPIAHIAWVQRADAGQLEEVVMDLYRYGKEHLRGNARMVPSRFTDLYLDLEYVPENRIAQPMATAPGDDPSAAAMGMPRYRLVRQQRIRDAELHYFDHPAFGVIATIRRIVPPETQD